MRKLIRAKIKLQENYPFFGRLILLFNFEEDDSEYTAMGPFCVTENNTIVYNKSKVETIPEKYILGFLAHEVMHVVLKHHKRLENRDPIMFNIACDLAVNNILVQNGFELYEDMLIPENDRFDFEDIHINNISKKSAEKIYKDLVGKQSLSKIEVPEHVFSNNVIDIENQVNNSLAFASEQGKPPLGIKKGKEISWNRLLRKYFNSNIISNYSFSKPKRLAGLILPGKICNDINVLVHIDTSASIDPNDMNLFVKELKKIRSIDRNAKTEVVLCNDKITDKFYIEQNKVINVRTGGNTSHKEVVKYLNSKRSVDVFISMTDGFSDIEEYYPKINKRCKKLILLTNDYNINKLKQFAKIIEVY